MKKPWIISLCLSVILLAGCGQSAQSPASAEESPAAVMSGYMPSFEAEDLDSNWAKSAAVQIALSDSGTEITGAGAVALEGGVKISKGGVYVLSGTLTDGRIVADVERGEELTLVLNGVDITCLTSAPLYISNGDVTIILEAGTENVLTDASAYQYANETVTEPNACLYGDDNLTILGTGKLTVNANFNNGIGTKDELRIGSASLVVHAVNNAVKGNDCVLIRDASLQIDSEGDGIKSDETKHEGHGVISIVNSRVEILADDDGLQATSLISAADGQIKITASGKKINCKGAISLAEGVLQ